MSTENNSVCNSRIKMWKRATILFLSIAVMLVVTIFLIDGSHKAYVETSSKQIEALEAENALLEKRKGTFTNEIITLLDMSTADEWSIHKRNGKDYTMLLTKGDVSVWATEDNLQETIDWLDNTPMTEE